MPPTVAILAQGAMGAGVARRLTDHGVTVLTSLHGRSPASAARAAAAGMQDVGDAGLAAADLLLSIVPPAEARATAQRLAPHLAAAARPPVYVDCNATAPATVQDIAAVIAPTGCPFADAAIIGPPPRPGEDRTVFHVCGPAADALSRLGRHGLDVRLVHGPVGAASALKMGFAGISKGLTGLAAAMVLAADHAGAAPALARELERMLPGVLPLLRRGLPDMIPKAYRWAGEMEEIAAFVEAGLGATGPGIAETYRGLATHYAALGVDAAGPGRAAAVLETFAAAESTR